MVFNFNNRVHNNPGEIFMIWRTQTKGEFGKHHEYEAKSAESRKTTKEGKVFVQPGVAVYHKSGYSK